MPQRRLQHGAGVTALAYASALVLLLSVVFPASAEICMVQKSYDSREYGGKHARPPSESIIRTWAAEGKLRQDYGDPPTFIYIVRLDRRPGELISYLIDLGTGHFGNTYWTFCHPHPLALPSQPTGPDHMEKACTDVKESVPAGSTGPHEALAVTDTGDTKLINSFQCRKYLLKGRLSSREFSSEVWASTDIASALDRCGLIWGVRIDQSDSHLRFRGDSNRVPEEMRTIKGFPVLVTEIEQNRYVHYERRLELLEFREESVSSNQFDLPKGLTKKYRGAMAHPPECDD